MTLTVHKHKHAQIPSYNENDKKTVTTADPRLRQFSLFLVARSGKLGYKTVCPNVSEYQNSMCKVKKSEYVDC